MGILPVFCILLFSFMAAAPPGPVVDIDSNDPEVQACASFALEIFNIFNGDPQLYAITKFTSVKRAISQIDGGMYDMEVELGKTNCPKKSHPTLRSCHPLTAPEAKVQHCHFTVLSDPRRKQRTLIKSFCVSS